MKDVPYFPLYAANIISSRTYKLMSLGERGLWITIFMECWVNGGVPSDFKQMAKILGFSEQELKQFFSNYQTTFFHVENSQYICRELEEYRQGYIERREKQRLGGLKGAREKKEKQEKELLKAQLHTQPQGMPKGQPIGSLSYINSASIESGSINSNQNAKKALTEEEFDKWMGNADDAPDISNQYLRASRG